MQKITIATDQVTSQLIQLSEMPQALRVLIPEDDWTGVSDQKDRRRRQNRINQRAHRQRKDGKMPHAAPIFRPIQPSLRGMVQGQPVLKVSGASELLPSRGPGTIEISMSTLKKELQAISSSQKEQDVNGLVRYAHKDSPDVRNFLERTTVPGSNIESRVIFPLSSDHLLTLVKYNIFRAIVANALCLGIDPSTICREEPLPVNFEDLPASSLPPNLQPTNIQRATPHHVLIDLFPLPEVRNNLLLAGNQYDSEALAADIFDVGVQSHLPERQGFIVWGEPWDAGGWEVSESFAKRWPWVLNGCNELLRSTDYWRMKRGEKGLMDILKSSQFGDASRSSMHNRANSNFYEALIE
ncbi:hypothetical protein BGZ60DRAFT_481645 [Tricladium varicosporioides]|nr:hypothetical protein BGZ60DRAFT_481645 [Hymenoscyphus varicosporioides]